MALFTSSAVGGSTMSAVFSSAERSGSRPRLVTHGCSYCQSALDYAFKKFKHQLAVPPF